MHALAAGEETRDTLQAVSERADAGVRRLAGLHPGVDIVCKSLHQYRRRKDSRRGEGCLLDTSLVQAFFRVILADNADLLSADAQATLQATKNSCERSEDERVFAAAALATMTGAPQQAAECKPWYELWWVWLIVALGVLLVALAVALGVSESRRHHAHSEAMAAEAGHVAARQTAARLLAGRN